MELKRLGNTNLMVPEIGLGVWQYRGGVEPLRRGIELGAFLIDTAEMYDNEREVGEGLRGSGIKRSEAFITTKIWPSHFAPRELERAAKESLVLLCHKRLRCVYCWIATAQHGHRERLLTRATINRRRMVAIELGMCRSGRSGGSSGSVIMGNGNLREQPGGTRS